MERQAPPALELGPFGYDAENHTRSLWMAEGVTTYYGDLLVRRAGLSTTREYLDHLSDRDRRAAGVARASRPDAGGRVVRRVDQALSARRELAEHGGELLHERRGRCVPARHRDPARHRRRTVAGRGDAPRIRQDRGRARLHRRRIPCARQRRGRRGPRVVALDARSIPPRSSTTHQRSIGLGCASGSAHGARSAAEGLAGRGHAERWRPAHHLAGAPRIRRHCRPASTWTTRFVAVDEHRVRAEGWDARMEAYRPGDRVTVLVARRERMMRLGATLAAEPPRSWRLEQQPNAADVQRTRSSSG